MHHVHATGSVVLFFLEGHSVPHSPVFLSTLSCYSVISDSILFVCGVIDCN